MQWNEIDPKESFQEVMNLISKFDQRMREPTVKY